MRTSITKSLALALALAVAAPAIGCAAPTDSDRDENVGETEQALGVGDAVAGAKGALQVISMIQTYQKYGKLEISTADIFDAVNAMQADVTALKASVAELQSAVTTTNKDVLNVVALSKTNEMDALWDGYRNAAAAKDPTVVASYLAAIAKNQAVQGTLHFSDLATLNDVLVGKNGSSSLITLMAQTITNDVKAGKAKIEDDALGKFVAEKRLLQEEAFLLLSQAAANDPTVNLEQQKAAHQARMDEQAAAFFEATHLFNQTMMDKVAAARAAQVAGCRYNDEYIFGFEMWPNDGWFAFNDVGQYALSTVGGNPIPGDSRVEGRVACDNARADHVKHVTNTAKREMRRNLLAAETVFRTWSDHTAKTTPGIQIVSARYGSVSPNIEGGLWFDPSSNEISSDVWFLCGNRASCDLTLDPMSLGRADYDRTKNPADFVLEYRCSGGAIKTVRIPSEADNKVVTLSCDR